MKKQMKNNQLNKSGGYKMKYKMNKKAMSGLGIFLLIIGVIFVYSVLWKPLFDKDLQPTPINELLCELQYKCSYHYPPYKAILQESCEVCYFPYDCRQMNIGDIIFQLESE